MKLFVFLLALLPLSGSSAAAPVPPEGPGTPLKYEDLDKLVKERNEHVRAAATLLKSVEARTGHLGRSYLPKVTAEGGAESFQFGPYDPMTQPVGAVTASLNLFHGGRDYLEEKGRDAQVVQAEAEYQDRYVEEMRKARREFWTLIYQRELAKILKEALVQNEKNLAAAKRRVSAGLTTETDRIEFEIYRTQLEQDVAKLTLAEAASQRTLAVLLGVPAGTRFETRESIPFSEDDQILEAKLEPSAHRDVKAQLASQEIASVRKSQANRWWLPSVDVYGSYSLYPFREREFFEQRDRYEGVLGVKLTIDLFDRLQPQVESKAAGLQAESYESQAGQTSRELLAQFETARTELRINRELVEGAEKNVAQGKRYLTGTLSEYARGVKNSPDVLAASQRLVEFQRRYVELRRDYQIARADLLAILGK